MKPILLRAILLSLLTALIMPNHIHAAETKRTALVIGNSAYSSGPLKNPVNDAADMAITLKKLGFRVTLKKNVTLREMEEAVSDFGGKLKRGGVGLFFYAGHGLQVGGTNYLVPIGAKIDKESQVKYETMDAGRVLDAMADAGNGLNIVILDACRDNPYARSFRNATRGLAIVNNAPVGTFISYSTGPGNVARDGEGRNSPYTESLSRYMQEPGLSIEQVFKKVRARLGQETGNLQIPWELSSLQGEFYFTPGNGNRSVDVDQPIQAASERRVSSADEIKKLEEEKERLEAERTALTEEKKQLSRIVDKEGREITDPYDLLLGRWKFSHAGEYWMTTQFSGSPSSPQVVIEAWGKDNWTQFTIERIAVYKNSVTFTLHYLHTSDRPVVRLKFDSAKTRLNGNVSGDIYVKPVTVSGEKISD